MELHHPIMSKLWDPGDRTQRRSALVPPVRWIVSYLWLTSSWFFLNMLRFFVKPFTVFFLSSLDIWSISKIASRREDESVVASVDGVIFSLNLDHVFVYGELKRIKVDGRVDCELRPRSCWKFLWSIMESFIWPLAITFRRSMSALEALIGMDLLEKSWFNPTKTTFISACETSTKTFLTTETLVLVTRPFQI